MGESEQLYMLESIELRLWDTRKKHTGIVRTKEGMKEDSRRGGGKIVASQGIFWEEESSKSRMTRR